MLKRTEPDEWMIKGKKEREGATKTPKQKEQDKPLGIFNPDVRRGG